MFKAVTLLVVFFGTWLSICTSVSAQQAYVAASTELYFLDYSTGTCNLTLIGDFIDNTGNFYNLSDIAICPDGTLYGTDGIDLFEINPNTALITTIGFLNPTDFPNSLTCGPDNTLYGARGNLSTINRTTAATNAVGLLPAPAAGDIAFYNGEMYLSSLTGIWRLDLINLANSEFLGSSGAYWGLCAGVGCNELLGSTSGGRIDIINIETGATQVLCNNVQGVVTGLASMDDFSAVNNCVVEIDLDDDDSAGLPDFDYQSEDFSCLTPDGVAIADQDVIISGTGTIENVYIEITNPLNLNQEILTIAGAVNVLVAGDNSTNMTLSSNGTSSIADFENAIKEIRYINTAAALAVGTREITVYFETPNEVSNIATAYIEVQDLPYYDVVLTPDTVICDGESLTLEAATTAPTVLWSTGESTSTIQVTSSGTYHVTVTAPDHCTTIDSVVVTALPVYTMNLSYPDEICEGEGFDLIIENSYPDSVEYIIIDNYGIQQVHKMLGIDTITFNPDASIFLEIISINTAMPSCWTQPLGIAFVNVIDEIILNRVERICSGDSIFLAGAWQFAPGQYHDMYSTNDGCDSLVSTVLIVDQSDTLFQQVAVCHPDSAGRRIYAGQNSIGCDSLVITDLVFNEYDTLSIISTVCDSSLQGITIDTIVDSNGCALIQTLYELFAPSTIIINTENSCDLDPPDPDTVVLSNVNGCDSIIVTQYVSVGLDTTRIENYSCDSTQLGVIIDSYLSAQGCDSIIEQTTYYSAVDSTRIMSTTCDRDAAGEVINIYQGQSGCDSVVIETTVWIGVDTTYSNSTSCDSSNIGTEYIILVSNSGCDSVVLLTTNYSPVDSTMIELATCDRTMAGETVAVYQGQSGCDSVVIEIMFWVGVDTTYIDRSSCDSLNVGTEFIVSMSSAGCDSIVSVTTYYSSIDSTKIQLTTCDRSEAGETIMIYQGQSGCDSIVVETRNWVGVDTTSFERFSCDPGAVGIEIFTYQSSSGCDSIVRQQVGYQALDTTSIFEAYCDPDSLTIRFNRLISVDGCDSVIQLIPYLDSAINCSSVVRSDIFIPNVFSPNNDGVNDYLSIYSPNQNVVVDHLQIFNRWGGTVFTHRETPLVYFNPGWNGEINGKKASEGVYILIAKLYLGETVHYIKKDILLIR